MFEEKIKKRKKGGGGGGSNGEGMRKQSQLLIQICTRSEGENVVWKMSDKRWITKTCFRIVNFPFLSHVCLIQAQVLVKVTFH